MQEKLHTLKMLITSWHTKKFITTHTINMTDKTIIFTNAYQEPSVFTSIQNFPQPKIPQAAVGSTYEKYIFT